MAVYTLDTSAVSCLLRLEPGHEQVTNLLKSAVSEGHRILLPFIVAMEIEYVALRYVDRATVDVWIEDLESWPVEVVESYTGWRRTAAFVKSTVRLSLADAWVASLALLEDAELVHKDPEFDAVPALKHLRLPYAQRGAR